VVENACRLTTLPTWCEGEMNTIECGADPQLIGVQLPRCSYFPRLSIASGIRRLRASASVLAPRDRKLAIYKNCQISLPLQKSVPKFDMGN
jgi:hypothetical protein